jgi:TatA/E family protein of Tat protein translocase
MHYFPAFLGNIGWQELVLILIIVLVLFGPRRLPEIAEALGKSVRKFKESTRDAQTEIKKEIDAVAKDAKDAGEKR